MIWICALLVVYLAWLAVMTDCSARVLVPYVNGNRLGECRILKVGRWANSRVGLTNHIQLPRSGGLLLDGARGVHTRGMLFPIDIVVLKDGGEVERILTHVKPGQALRWRGRRQVLELAPGIAAQWGLWPGSRLEFGDE